MKITPNCEIFVRYVNGQYDSARVFVPLLNGHPDLSKLPTRLRGQDYKLLSHKILDVPTVPVVPTASPVSAIPTKLDLQGLQNKFNKVKSAK